MEILKTKVGHTITGAEISYIKMSYKKGLRHFTELGYTICRNTRFMKKDNHHVHFNNLDKHWIIG